MSVVYLLPCPHGKHVEVTVADAGRTVMCPCGKPVVVPTMRELRELKTTSTGGSPSASAADWSIQQGLMFSVGLVIIVASLIAIAKLGYDAAQLDTEKIEISDEHLAKWDDLVHNMDAAHTLELYAILDQPLEDRTIVPPFEENRERARGLYRYMLVAAVICGSGLLLLLTGIFIRPRRRGAMRRPKQPAKPTASP